MEVYFAGNPDVIRSGRRPKIKHYITQAGGISVFDDVNYDNDLIAMIRFLRERSIRCNLLLNFNGLLTLDMIQYVSDLITAGVNVVTVGNMPLLEQVCGLYQKTVSVQNSVYIKIESLSDIELLLQSGVSILLAPPELNHDLDRLTQVNNLVGCHGAELKIMVNEGCIMHCPHRGDDLNDAQSFAMADAINNYLENSKGSRTLSQPCRSFLGTRGISRTNYIHPDEIYNYSSLNPVLKIVGRSLQSENIILACQAYTTGHYDGDLRCIVENFKHATQPVLHDVKGKAVFFDKTSSTSSREKIS